MEHIIDEICYNFAYKTLRMYRQNARKDYLNLAKSKERTAKSIRKAIKKQLQYIRHKKAYLDAFLACDEVVLSAKQEALIGVLDKVVEQQKYM